MMVKCIDCFHFGACKGVKAANEIVDTHSDTEPIMCDFFESQSSITGKTNALWVENRPNEDVMSQFVKLGIARGMSSKSTFWTCSIAALLDRSILNSALNAVLRCSGLIKY